MTRKDARRFALFMFAEAADCIPDKEGRVLIPPALRAYANLEHEVVIIGVNDHLEIWNPDAYRQLNSTLEQDADSLAEKLDELGIL
jgi:MraZ protein